MSHVTRGRGAVLVLVLVVFVMLMAGGGPTRAEQAPPPPAQGPTTAPPAGRGGGGLAAGPIDLPAVDAAAAGRGRTVYAARCINCHGTQARGTDKGANLVRSLVVLRDRYGSALRPFLAKGHPTQSAGEPLTDDQIGGLAHFLRQRVNDTLRGSPIFQAGNVLTGNATAGAAFFNGDGKCAGCHGPASSIAGIGGRLTPVDLQQRFLFPRTGRGRGAGATGNPSAITVTVTPPGQPAVSGVLVQMDDFDVSLRDATGAYRAFKRSPGVKVVKTDPLAAHIALLDTITDRQLHDVVAYLETLK